MAAICIFVFSYFCQKFKFASTWLAKFGEDLKVLGRVIAYFLFSKRLPSAILDLIWRHSGPPTVCVIDSRNMLLKLHVDRIYTLQAIAIFIFGPFGLKLPIHALLGEFFLGYYPLNEFRYCRNPPQKDLRPWAKTRRTSHKPWKSILGFDLGACPSKIQYNQPTNLEKVIEL